MRAKGFSCKLDISKLQILIKKYKKIISCIFFLQLLFIKTLDPDWIRNGSGLDPDLDSLEMVDPDPDSMNPDSQLCFLVYTNYLLPQGPAVLRFLAAGLPPGPPPSESESESPGSSGGSASESSSADKKAIFIIQNQT